MGLFGKPKSDEVYQKAKKYYDTGRYGRAYLQFEKLSKMDGAQEQNEAFCRLGDMKLNGKGVETDVNSAFTCFALAAEDGHPEAMGYLGVMFLQGMGTTCNIGVAIKWLQRAVRAGYSPAKAGLGQFYDAYAKDKDVDWDKTIQIVREKFEEAESEESEGFEERVGDKPEEYYPYVVRCWLAAEEGILEAQFLLGEVHQRGRELGVYYDSKEALYWYEKAGEQGHAEAAFRAARIYEQNLMDSGAEVFFRSDIEPILQWYNKAIDLGHKEASSRIVVPLLIQRFYDSLVESYGKTEPEEDLSDIQERDSAFLTMLELCEEHGRSFDPEAYPAAIGYRSAVDLYRKESEMPVLGK